MPVCIFQFFPLHLIPTLHNCPLLLYLLLLLHQHLFETLAFFFTQPLLVFYFFQSVNFDFLLFLSTHFLSFYFFLSLSLSLLCGCVSLNPTQPLNYEVFLRHAAWSFLDMIFFFFFFYLNLLSTLHPEPPPLPSHNLTLVTSTPHTLTVPPTSSLSTLWISHFACPPPTFLFAMTVFSCVFCFSLINSSSSPPLNLPLSFVLYIDLSQYSSLFFSLLLYYYYFLKKKKKPTPPITWAFLCCFTYYIRDCAIFSFCNRFGLT